MVVDLAKDAAETSLTQIDAVKYLASHHVFSQDLPSVSRKNSQALHLSAWSPIVPRGRLAKKTKKVFVALLIGLMITFWRLPCQLKNLSTAAACLTS